MMQFTIIIRIDANEIDEKISQKRKEKEKIKKTNRTLLQSSL